MKIVVVFLCAILYTGFTSAQTPNLVKIADSISAEGLRLYHSEFASWYGTDLFIAKFPNRQKDIGGYLSYKTNDGERNIFFGKGDDPEVFASTQFYEDYNPQHYQMDTVPRKLTARERELFVLRQAVVKQIQRDTFYKSFKNTNLNPIPVIHDGRKVYVLTGPKISGVIIFGNDYLITFDQNNQIIDRKVLHKNIIPVVFKSKRDTGKVEVAGVHTHQPSTGDFITATDICTLMLYEKYTTWKSYMVRSKNYTSIWDCKMDKLVILTNDAVKKIIDYKDSVLNKH